MEANEDGDWFPTEISITTFRKIRAFDQRKHQPSHFSQSSEISSDLRKQEKNLILHKKILAKRQIREKKMKSIDHSPNFQTYRPILIDLSKTENDQMNDLEQFLKNQAEIEARNDQSTVLEKLCKLPTHLKISSRRNDLLRSGRRRSKGWKYK